MSLTDKEWLAGRVEMAKQQRNASLRAFLAEWVKGFPNAAQLVVDFPYSRMEGATVEWGQVPQQAQQQNILFTEHELSRVCSLTLELTRLRQNECKHLCVEHVAPEIFQRLLSELTAVKRGKALTDSERYP